MIDLIEEPTNKMTSAEKLLGFRVKNGMTWYQNIEAWGCPLILHMQKAVEVIEQLIKEKGNGTGN
jgi:hypothetical protein